MDVERWPSYNMQCALCADILQSEADVVLLGFYWVIIISSMRRRIQMNISYLRRGLLVMGGPEGTKKLFKILVGRQQLHT